MEDSSSSRTTSWFDRYFASLDARKPSDRFITVSLLWLLLIGVMVILFAVNERYTATFPADGGVFSEGIVGTPRFVNPVLAITRADQDLVALVYSGLLTLSPEGTLENDLAESITVSDDGTVYNVILRTDRTFHDGQLIQSDDVAFTVSLIQDPELKSPLRGSWNEIEVEVISPSELNFVLTEAYVPFIENLTLGILPKHVWETLSIEELPFSQLNTEPVGSGPYEVRSVARDVSGLINAYTLDKAATTESNIATVKLRFFADEAALVSALKKGEVLASASIPAEQLAEFESEKYQFHTATLPRTFAVFLNQNRGAAMRDKAAREALNTAIDRDGLVNEVLAGYGVPSQAPVPFSASSSLATNTIALAKARLSEGGWEQKDNGRWYKEIDEEETELSITIATANTPLFESTANYLEQTWSELGVVVSVALFEQSDLVQAVIRPRDYQALLFGTDVGRQQDLYPFWHSSQRTDPGLNVALYTNITTDALLEQARTEQDEVARSEIMKQIVDEIVTETPAIFLYNPSLTYVVHQSVTSEPVSNLEHPSERFVSINRWYMQKERVWPLFAD